MSEEQELVEAPQLEVETPLEAVDSTAEATVQESQEESVEQPNKTPEWVQRRFNEMTRDKHEAQRKAEAAQQEAATYRRLMEAMQKGETVDQSSVGKAPVVADEERIKAAARELNQVEMFNARCNEVWATGNTDYPDFENAVKNLGMLGVSQEFLQGAVGLEDAHKVIYALGSNPDEASRILALPALQQGRELERLASKAPVKAVKPVSRAPAPIQTTVDGSGSGVKDPDKMSTAEWMAWRNSQARKR